MNILKFHRPISVSLYYAVLFLERLNPKGPVDYKNKLNQTYKKYKVSHVTKRMIAKFYFMKLKNNDKWQFFKKNVNCLTFIHYNKNKLELTEYQKTWIIDYRDFFIFKYEGVVIRKDGNKGFKDKLDRQVIKDFQGKLRIVSELIYAAGKDCAYPLSYKTMKERKILFEDGNKNNLIISNLKIKVKDWTQL